jgi:hypothetical protein
MVADLLYSVALIILVGITGYSFARVSRDLGYRPWSYRRRHYGKR